jgi:hypothetical protein
MPTGACCARRSSGRHRVSCDAALSRCSVPRLGRNMWQRAGPQLTITSSPGCGAVSPRWPGGSPTCCCTLADFSSPTASAPTAVTPPAPGGGRPPVPHRPADQSTTPWAGRAPRGAGRPAAGGRPGRRPGNGRQHAAALGMALSRGLATCTSGLLVITPMLDRPGRRRVARNRPLLAGCTLNATQVTDAVAACSVSCCGSRHSHPGAVGSGGLVLVPTWTVKGRIDPTPRHPSGSA